jgi:hypothetical protein
LVRGKTEGQVLSFRVINLNNGIKEASEKMSLIVPMLVAYNFISNVVGKTYRYTEEWISSIVEYMSGMTNEWYILDKGPVPVIPAPVYRKSDISQISWVYNMAYNVLAAPHSNEPSVRLPFLSASIVSNDKEYPLDDFLQEFRIIHDSENGKILTPREIVLCWEIYSKTWLDNAVLNVIDQEGNDYSVDGFGNGGEEWSHLLYAFEDDTEEEEGEEQEEEDLADDEASTQEEEAEEEKEEEKEEQVLPVLEQEAPLVASITLLHSESEVGEANT